MPPHSPLPEGMRVSGWLSLYGCTALTKLPTGLNVVGGLGFKNLSITNDRIILIRRPCPETILSAAIGRRVGDVIQDWALSYRGTADRIIKRIETDRNNNLVFLLEDGR